MEKSSCNFGIGQLKHPRCVWALRTRSFAKVVVGIFVIVVIYSFSIYFVVADFTSLYLYFVFVMFVRFVPP